MRNNFAILSYSRNLHTKITEFAVLHTDNFQTSYVAQRFSIHHHTNYFKQQH